MSHHQLVTRYWILAISTNYGCECNGDIATIIGANPPEDYSCLRRLASKESADRVSQAPFNRRVAHSATW